MASTRLPSFCVYVTDVGTNSSVVVSGTYLAHCSIAWLWSPGLGLVEAGRGAYKQASEEGRPLSTGGRHGPFDFGHRVNGLVLHQSEHIVALKALTPR